MKQKLIASIAGFTLASIAAVGAFASQDAVGVLDETPTIEVTETPAGDATETPQATETPVDGTPTLEPSATPETTETPESTEAPVDGTPTPETTATAEPEPTDTPEGGEEDDKRDVGGIPDSNPVFTDDDGDGVCEKHETREKETPSGNIVRVPCHAGKEDEGAPSDDDDDDEGGSRSDDERKPKKHNE